MNKIKTEYEAKMKLQIEADSTELTKMAQQIGKINENLSGVGESTMAQAKQLEEKMQKQVAMAKKKEASGEFDKDPQSRVVFQQQMNKSKMEYYKIVNRISGAYTRHLAGSEKEKKAIDEVNKKIKSKTALIRENTKAMDALVKKTETVNKKRASVAKQTGVDPSKLMTLEGVDEAIASKLKPGSKHKKWGEAKNVEALEKYRDELTKTIDQVEEWEEEQKKISTELNKQYADLKTTRAERAKILETILDSSNVQEKLGEEQREIIKGLIKEEKIRDEIADQAEKTAAAEKSGAVEKNINNVKKMKEANEKEKKSWLGKLSAATLYYAALRSVQRLMNSVIEVVTELDKSLTEVAMVTNLTRKEAWGLVDAYQNLAQEVGTTTDEIARLSVYFFRQGRSAKDALELTKIAAIAAKVASIDATESANYLTSAINGFGLAATQAMAVSDKFAALGASSASSYEEMAVALSKVAPSAKVAGVGIDFMMGILAKGIETTREAPENIGTAFKTVFARMTQIKDFGATLEEGISVNQVEEALKQADVALRSSTGEFRDMEDVLKDLGYAWDGLNRNQQSYIATALAGTRQQSRLLAVMQNFDRTIELVNVSLDSAGATLAQHAEYSGGMEASLARLKTAWEGVILAFSNSDAII